MGACILIGFSTGGSSTGTFEDWAAENVLSKFENIPRRGSTPYATWMKTNFLTATSGDIPDPPSKTKSALTTWAKQYFLTTNV